jgi:hypothetical protein
MSSSATYQAGVELLLVGGVVQGLDAMPDHEPLALAAVMIGLGRAAMTWFRPPSADRKVDERGPTLCHFLTYRCAATKFFGTHGSRRLSRCAKKRV